MITAKYALVLLIVFALLLAPRIWRMRHLADQRRRHPWPDLPTTLRGNDPTFVLFTTRYCAQCAPVERALRAARAEATVHVIYVEREPRLAAGYKVRTAPTVIEATADGAVRRRLVGAEAVLAQLRGAA
jgi:hypothetical protein